MWPFQRKPTVKWYSKYSGCYDTEYLDKFASESEFLEGVPEELFYLPRKIYLSDVVEWRKIKDKDGKWPTYRELYMKYDLDRAEKEEEGVIWKNIIKTQPRVYQEVLWYCQGGAIKTGMYYGKDYCSRLPSCHPLHGRSRKHYGKFGRYAEPAGDGYVVTHWMTLPEPPQGKGE